MSHDSINFLLFGTVGTVSYISLLCLEYNLLRFPFILVAVAVCFFFLFFFEVSDAAFLG